MIDKFTARELADRLDADESFTLVDTRPADSYEAWHVRGAENLPFDPNESMSDEQFEEVVDLGGDEVVAICGKGISSTSFALELAERRNGHEFDVGVVQGGMEDWSKVYDVAAVDLDDEDLVLRQVQRRAKGCLGYVVGSRSAGEAIAVDVTRQTDAYKVAAQEAGLRIARVVDTHVHADHISGGPELADELDVPYHLSGHLDDREAEIDLEFEPIADGDALSVGEIDLDVVHTPGHTSEMVTLLVDETAALTSDTLFADGVGRTELQFGDEDAERGAELLYDSVNDEIGALDDDVTILPGHVTVTEGGEFEVGSPGEAIRAKLGDLRDRLDAFAFERDEFVERVVDGDSEKPPNYETVVAVNAGEESVGRDEEAAELELGPNNCAA